jgi:hypothetical protein
MDVAGHSIDRCSAVKPATSWRLPHFDTTSNTSLAGSRGDVHLAPGHVQWRALLVAYVATDLPGRQHDARFTNNGASLQASAWCTASVIKGDTWTHTGARSGAWQHRAGHWQLAPGSGTAQNLLNGSTSLSVSEWHHLSAFPANHGVANQMLSARVWKWIVPANLMQYHCTRVKRIQKYHGRVFFLCKGHAFFGTARRACALAPDHLNPQLK